MTRTSEDASSYKQRNALEAVDDPAAAVSSQFAAILARLAFAASAVRAHQVPVLLGQAVSKLVTVIRFVGDHRRRLLAELRFFAASLRPTLLPPSTPSGRNMPEVLLGHLPPLCTFSTLGFSHFMAPFLPKQGYRP